ncbi:uncharacterized protein LOC126990837 isoform X5 [Eriocheir sinensis]|uniref:uncharacterized protein LOC126990837 isoform X5 n=1 Tax=Eriocheir sinensis TaxID=95602 RepID=UPI0021C93C5D|nr:uncharacterized protein LOC126990837 isoform X5 [Eriocheir sinensis]
MRGTMDGAGLSGDGQAETGDQNSQVFFIECVSAAVVSMNTCSEAPRPVKPVRPARLPGQDGVQPCTELLGWPVPQVGGDKVKPSMTATA